MSIKKKLAQNLNYKRLKWHENKINAKFKINGTIIKIKIGQKIKKWLEICK